MPEENWQAHGGIPACDLCHARKVKCDRQDPCANCTAAKAECLRTRQKRAPRPKVRSDEKFQALADRLSSLEDSVRVNRGDSRALSPGHDILSAQGIDDDEATPDRPLKRKRGDGSLSEVVSPELDTSQQQANEARNLIRKELSYNKLSTHQRSVLETALSFFDHLSQAPAPSIEDRSTFDSRMHVPMDLTHGEILNVIIGTENKPIDSVAIQFHSLDHIPPKAVERIALALIEGTDDERTLTLYKVIIHFKAAVVLYTSQLQAPKSQAVQKHIRQKQLHHLSAALTAIDHISFLTAPSLLLLQALITGAMLMQIVGNPASCWNLIAHASRTLVALGYHTIRDTTPKNESDEEIHAAIAWCAQFDSCMSLLLLRPSSLPPLNVKVSSLIKVDPSNPMTVFEVIAMEMVPVHNKIIELTLDPGPKNGSGAKGRVPFKEEVNILRKHMREISDLMDKYRPDHLLDANMDIMLHWQSLEFKYFSTMTAAHRLSPTVTTHPMEREECLQCAREALKRVKFIQEIGKRQGHFIEGYDPYLAWTILSYPLCPFFVVFCNVVGTSNVVDFQLLEDVAEVISSLVTENKYVNRLHRLCVALLGFCRPLVQPTSTAENTHIAIPEATPAITPQVEPEIDSLNGIGINNNINVNGFVASSWDDDMMWQLFQSQPSLDWFNSDILDPTWNLGLPK